jgi:hypothetical protein
MEYQRVQLGDEVPIAFQVYDASGNPAAPDAAPTVKVYSENGTKVYDKSFPPKDIGFVSGLFGHFVRLGMEFSAQVYSWRASYTVGGVDGVASGCFGVMPGGHADGAVIAMHWCENSAGNAIVYQTDSGKVKHGRNPR